ncbi:hypothetical protein KSW81_005870 [Nannochloris sp. 'desiccata']|nr:hypothetical protein KSW81_005870 [Chlorella desiccata (nom. nud.)]
MESHHRRQQTLILTSRRNSDRRGANGPLHVQAFQLFQQFNARSEAKSARNELLSCIAKDDAAKSARISELIDILISPENRRFDEKLLGGGPWQVVYTRGAFLWQVYTSPGKLVAGTSNRAAQDFNPSTRAVLNTGEIAGASIQVSAVGSYTPADSSITLPKEVGVTITGGEINAWKKKIPLPIKGNGKFYIEYVDDTIRVFRSTNGGLTVQVREDKLAKLRQKEKK